MESSWRPVISVFALSALVMAGVSIWGVCTSPSSSTSTSSTSTSNSPTNRPTSAANIPPAPSGVDSAKLLACCTSIEQNAKSAPQNKSADMLAAATACKTAVSNGAWATAQQLLKTQGVHCK